MALWHGLRDKASTAVAVAAFLGAEGSREGAFPNVTYPGFSAFAEAQLQLAVARALSWNPLVPSAQLDGWSAYARAHLPELDAPPAFAAAIAASAARGVYERNASAAIVPSDRSRAFTTPVWQIAPFEGNAAALFYDLHSQLDRQLALDLVLATCAPAVTDIITLTQDRAANVSRASGIVFAPVFDGAPPANASCNASAVVGFTSVVFSWDSFLDASLPAFITEMDAVLSSQRNGATVTFHIAAGAVAFTSAGDTHQRGQERLAVASDLAAAELGDGFSLVLYPTSALQRSYESDNPQNACVGVVCIIVAVALVFRLYDISVSYHSSTLAQAASVANRIVEGVFPRTVRSRLFQHHAHGAAAAHGAPGAAPSRSSQDSEGPQLQRASTAGKMLQQLLRGHSRSRTPRQSAASDAAEQQGAIADHFDDCTVLFADLVSFTRWAGDVPPERVFQVLEAVFGEFDTAARRHNVFKARPRSVGSMFARVGALTPARGPGGDHRRLLSCSDGDSGGGCGARVQHGSLCAGAGAAAVARVRALRVGAGRAVAAGGPAQRQRHCGRAARGPQPLPAVWRHGQHREPHGEHGRGGAHPVQRRRGGAAARGRLLARAARQG